MITTIRIAYKIGFASALNYGVTSAYAEAAKYDFGTDAYKSRRMVRAFCRGFGDAIRISIAVRRETDETPYSFLEQEHSLLFKQ